MQNVTKVQKLFARFKECLTMENFDKTMKFNYDEIPKEDVKTVLQNVYKTLEEKTIIL